MSYYIAVVFVALALLATLSTLTFVYIMLRTKDHEAISGFVGSILLTSILWIASFMFRRKVPCPLCHGTPLMDNGATKHSQACRIPPFSYGISTIIHVILSQRFTCMYCGSFFDLLKAPGITRRR